MKVQQIANVLLSLLKIRKNRDTNLNILHAFSKYLETGYRFNWNSFDWYDFDYLNKVMATYGETGSFNTQRRFFIDQSLRLVGHLEGDTAECGVFCGLGSQIILAHNLKADNTPHHHVFDSFEGLSKPDEPDGDYWESGNLSVAKDIVAKNLHKSGNGNFTLYEGWIPERFADVTDKKFRFVHVDVDLYQPTRDSVQFFYDRMVPGGILVCDDYGFKTCPGATQACNEILENKPEKMIYLPDGGGFFIRGVPTRPSGF